jgi:hypothetical protein
MAVEKEERATKQARLRPRALAMIAKARRRSETISDVIERAIQENMIKN